MEEIGIIGCFKMVKILDTTLREGEQTQGVKFSLEQKVEIARKLDEFGVDYIEAGMPIISDCDFQAVKAVADLVLRAEALGHARANLGDIDAVGKSGCKWVGIFCGINDLSLAHRIHERSRSGVYEKIANSIRYAKQRGLKVRYTVEDATRTELCHLIQIVKFAEREGANRFSIADTVGCASTEIMSELVSRLKKEVKIPIEVHCHNDLGLALANSLAAYKAGADIIDTTVNGLGERAGITSLQELSLALSHLYNQNDRRNLSMVTELSELVARCSGVRIDALRPVTGENAFTHTAKLHRDAVAENPLCYRFIDPLKIRRINRIKGPFSRFIGKPFVRAASELFRHSDGQGVRYVFMDRRNIPDTTLYAIVREVENIQLMPSHVDMHAHNCDSAFLFLGKNQDLTGLQCEVQLNDERYVLDSPASVFIPNGVPHSYRLMKGSGYYINFVLSPDYNRSIKI